MILLVALLLFGSQRLPELARNLGKSMREFKKATSGLEEELRRAMESPPAPPTPRQPVIAPAPDNASHQVAAPLPNPAPTERDDHPQP
jgi:TatA/E family protein of Tat protein translocase